MSKSKPVAADLGAVEREIIGYMCGVDWECELGEASGGNTIYASEQDLVGHRRCANRCGVVKVSVRLVEWVSEQDLVGSGK